VSPNEQERERDYTEPVVRSRRAAFFPVSPLNDKRNFKRLLRIERDGSIVERVFLDVPDPSLRELLICLHYLR
jgi:hypothetical protein